MHTCHQLEWATSSDNLHGDFLPSHPRLAGSNARLDRLANVPPLRPGGHIAIAARARERYGGIAAPLNAALIARASIGVVHRWLATRALPPARAPSVLRTRWARAFRLAERVEDSVAAFSRSVVAGFEEHRRRQTRQQRRHRDELLRVLTVASGHVLRVELYTMVPLGLHRDLWTRYCNRILGARVTARC